MSTFVIDLHDRPGSLERLLNCCRRKGFLIHTLQFGPAEPGVRRVAMELEDGSPPAARVLANLARIHDVIAVEEATEAAHAAAAHGTLRSHTTRAA